MNRRRFLTSSSSAIVAAALREWPALARGGQSRAATRFEDLRGGAGIFTGRGGTIGWLVTDEGAVVDRQSVPRHGGGVRRGAQTTVAPRHPRPDQHAPSRRSHGRQQGIPPGREIHRRARQLGGVAANVGGGGKGRGRARRTRTRRSPTSGS